MAQNNNLFYSELASTSNSPVTTATSSCPGVWSHEAYRELRDRYDQALEKLAAANAQMAAMSAVAQQASAAPKPIKPRTSTAPTSGSGANPNSSLATPPTPSLLASYRAQIGSWQRPTFTPMQLVSVPNYSKDTAASTRLQQQLPDLNGNPPTDQEWKAICKDRKSVAEDLLDKHKTWTNQREEIIDICITWMEKKHARLVLCDDSRWKAFNVLKARFEESRKPVTSGIRNIRKREPDEDEEEDALGLAAIGLTSSMSGTPNKGKGKGRAKKRKEDDYDIDVQ